MKRRKTQYFLAVLAVFAIGFIIVTSTKHSPSNTPQENYDQEVESVTESKQKTLKQLTGDEYKNLFLDSSHPNTKEISKPPTITGDSQLDARIAKLAEARGYKLQQVPISDLSEVNGVKAQYLLIQAWSQLKQAAAKKGIKLNIVSGLRTVEEQRRLFIQRLGASTTDSEINNVLAMTAPPGYSRHHSGYVIDISDASSPVFEYSPGYKWLSKNNYYQAKIHGLIPSYPEGAKNQGPEPEPWEYVWVGKNLLIE